MGFKVVIVLVVFAILNTFMNVSAVITNQQKVFYVTPSTGYNFTSLTNITGDYETILYTHDEYYKIYFNFWTDTISYCDPSSQGFKIQACVYKQSTNVYDQLSDPNTLVTTFNDGYVILNYTIPPGTPCTLPYQCINDRSTEWNVTCDPNADTVQNVICSQPILKFYQCSFRHSSACLVNLTSITPTATPTNNTNPTPSPDPLDPIIIPIPQNCSNNCHGNGVCVNGTCKCYSSYYGLDCSAIIINPPTPSPNAPNATIIPSNSSSNGSNEERYFDCSMSKNGMVVSSNQILNCSSSGITICKLQDGSIVSIPSGGSINIITKGTMDCKSDHIQCKSGYSSCSINYPVFSIDGKEVGTLPDHPLTESPASFSSVPTTIIATLLIISLLQLLI